MTMGNNTNSNVKLISITIMASFLISTTLLTACVSHNNTYKNTPKTIIKNAQGVPNHYQVKSGDTVSNIAEKFGLNYRTVARMNDLNSKYTIYAGQWLKLWDSKNTKKPSNNSFAVNNSTGYQYPTNNKIIEEFGSRGSDGMWFKGKIGDPVYATSDGKIMYAGSGLREFGNLIMIRHNDNLITAYAHNSRLLVQEGAHVRRGQKIATMGKTGDTKRVALQLQVRRGGRAINPRSVLDKK